MKREHKYTAEIKNLIINNYMPTNLRNFNINEKFLD